jgi:hypothetical protein
VRHRIGEKEVETAVTVTARTNISVRSIRRSVALYFKTDDVTVGGAMKTERHAEYDYDELEVVDSLKS